LDSVFFACFFTLFVGLFVIFVGLFLLFVALALAIVFFLDLALARALGSGLCFYSLSSAFASSVSFLSFFFVLCVLPILKFKSIPTSNQIKHNHFGHFVRSRDETLGSKAPLDFFLSYRGMRILAQRFLSVFFFIFRGMRLFVSKVPLEFFLFLPKDDLALWL
jgi:hypothetical protein